MPMPRSKIVDPQITPWYHCISKCVRGASLLKLERKRWIQDRLSELVDIFAIDVASFSVMDNHLHVLTHLDVKRSKSWSKEEVLRRWARLHPPRDARRRPLKCLKRWVKEKSADHAYVNNIRRRLVNLGWFMKSLKEPLARIVNELEHENGAFWAARYKSIAVMDEPALLATCIYIDLNPLAAGVVRRPEQARFTSLYLRLEHCRQRGRLADLQAARLSAAVGVHKCRGMETGLWLCPVEDRRAQGSKITGVMEGFSLGSYLLLLDATSRLVRPQKARVASNAEPLLDRLGTTLEHWQSTIERLFATPFPRGVTFSFDRGKLRAAAKRRGCRHVANLNGCPTS